MKVVYDPTLDQCFPGDLGVLNSRVVPVMLLVVPTTFDLGLLVLTIVKASRSRTFPESHPSSPIVCVIFNFSLSLTPKIDTPDAHTRPGRASVRTWNNEHHARESYMLGFRYFFGIVRPPKPLNLYTKRSP